jgi:hypothetical protein
MRSAVLVLGSLVLAQMAPAAGLRDLNLPELGAQRHVVLAEMRRQGMKLVDGADARMLFDGSPIGWPGARQTLFLFDGLTLQQIDLLFDAPGDDLATRDSFHELRNQLSHKLGSPWFDRAQDPKNKARGVTALALHAHASSWIGPQHKILLTSAYGASRRLRITIIPHVRFDEAELAGLDEDDAPWAAKGLSAWTKTVRLTASALLDDFGEQRALMRGAKLKGEPLSVHLRHVDIPTELAGVDREVVERRFDNFVDGHWDLALTHSSRGADIEIDVTIEPVIIGGELTFTMRVEAYVAKGKERGEVLYTASQMLK